MNIINFYLLLKISSFSPPSHIVNSCDKANDILVNWSEFFYKKNQLGLLLCFLLRFISFLKSLSEVKTKWFDLFQKARVSV